MDLTKKEKLEVYKDVKERRNKRSYNGLCSTIIEIMREFYGHRLSYPQIPQLFPELGAYQPLGKNCDERWFNNEIDRENALDDCIRQCEEEEFKEGDEIYVWNDDDKPKNPPKRTFIIILSNGNVLASDNYKEYKNKSTIYTGSCWKHWAKIPDKPKVISNVVTEVDEKHSEFIDFNINKCWGMRLMLTEREGQEYKGYGVSGHKSSIFLADQSGNWYNENGEVIRGFLYFKPHKS